MSGIIISGKLHPVRDHEGELDVTNYLDEPRLALRDGEDCRMRSARTWVRLIIAHTTRCRKARIKPGFGPKTNIGVNLGNWWRNNGRSGGAQLLVAQCGHIYQYGDLQLCLAYHAGQRGVNRRSFGIEIAQGEDGTLYEGQLAVAVRLITWCCRAMGIQMQCIDPALAHKARSRLQWHRKGRSWAGADCVGVFGHSNIHPRDKPQDPGREFFELLVQEGFEAFRYGEDKDDRVAWRGRQLGFVGCGVDGLPGPATVERLKGAGYEDGIWRLGREI
jgi:hypothetical protein